ncbi:MAG TPA: FAD-dependent oxidoreductase [Bacillota bacterium]|nr:FAD-dependent oxidoreductase [Bacillota bacterium]
MTEKIVVIGGVAAGAGAATKARRTNESAEIIMFERGSYVSFANCGLPYYVGGEIKERNMLFLVTPEAFRTRFNIDVRIDHEVKTINRAEKYVEVVDHTLGRTFKQPYTKLIVATGGTALKPPIPGINLKGISTLWTVPDVDSIMSSLREKRVSQVVVVGGGFVGLETAEAFLNQGVKVKLVERLPQVMTPLDPEMAGIITRHLEAKGAEVILSDGVKQFLGQELLEGVELTSGRLLKADLAVVAVGVKPELELIKEAGLALGETGGVQVNSRMQTSDPDIFAAGDIVESTNLITGRKVRVPLAGPANKQGRVAGANAAGGSMEFEGVLGTSVVKVCDLTAAKTGLNEREATEAGLDFFVSYTHNADHATYYPGATPMVIKLVAEKESGRLLGAQAVGIHGVDKRIDVLATAIYGRMTVYNLENLDLAYAPPYSSAKDPAIMAGLVASNVVRGEVEVMTGAQLLAAMKNGENLQVVDCRTPLEYSNGNIPGAKNIPVDEMRQRSGELEQGRTTVLYCGIGYRSYLSYKILEAQGFTNLKNFSGGFQSWNLAKSVEK